jgi:hypothetical protein
MRNTANLARWRISLLGRTPARYLGAVSAPDQASAMTKAIEFFGIAENLRFRVAAEQIIEAPEPARAHSAK